MSEVIESLVLFLMQKGRKDLSNNYWSLGVLEGSHLSVVDEGWS